MAETIEQLRDSLDGIRAQIAEARERRAAGDPDARLRVASLREEEEIAVDRLDLMEREDAERRLAAEEAARAAAAAVRAAQVKATLDRHEALARAVEDSAGALADAMTALIQNAQAIQSTEGMDAYWVNGVMVRAGLTVAAAWPYSAALLSAKPHRGWPNGWPAEERVNLASRMSG